MPGEYEDIDRSPSSRTITQLINIDKRFVCWVKLSRSMRDDFKKVTHQRGTDMQKFLSMFIDAYLADPPALEIKINDILVDRHRKLVASDSVPSTSNAEMESTDDQ